MSWRRDEDEDEEENEEDELAEFKSAEDRIIFLIDAR